jgi:hypothetical protein
LADELAATGYGLTPTGEALLVSLADTPEYEHSKNVEK